MFEHFFKNTPRPQPEKTPNNGTNTVQSQKNKDKNKTNHKKSHEVFDRLYFNPKIKQKNNHNDVIFEKTGVSFFTPRHILIQTPTYQNKDEPTNKNNVHSSLKSIKNVDPSQKSKNFSSNNKGDVKIGKNRTLFCNIIKKNTNTVDQESFQRKLYENILDN